MHLARGDIDVQRSRLPEGVAGVDATVQTMAKMAKGEYGSRSAKIRALAINIVNAAQVPNKDYFGMAKAIHEWVRDTIRYVRDPIGDGEDGETLNQETLSYPEETAFNSQAGDCDDMTILEMALLGSLGLQSYPVVIGTQPGRYSHVYLHIILPPGKYPNAGKVIAADPIMREWPIGKEAPDYKVKLKKLYTDLSGIGTMDIGAYASAPSYIDAKNVSSVGPALRSTLTDTGSRGRIMNAQEVARPSEDLDEMFNRNVHINVALKSADRNSLRPLGPMTGRREQKLTSFLQVDGAKKIPRLQSAKLVTVAREFYADRHQRPNMPAGSSGPTVGELCGLSDYLSALEADVNHHGKLRGVAGKRDPLHRAAAAVAFTKARARKASNKVHQIHRSIAMFGLGDDIAPEVSAAQEIEKLAHTVALKAQLLADKATNGSPERRATLNAVLERLHTLDDAFRIPDLIASLPTNLDPVNHASTKVSTMAATVFDDDAVRVARKAIFDRGARAIPASPLKNPMLPGGVVRDQMGRILYSDEMAGLDGFSLKKAIKKVTSAPANAVKIIAKVPAKIAAAAPKVLAKAITAPIQLTKKVVDAHKAFTMAHITGTMAAFKAAKGMTKGGNPFKGANPFKHGSSKGGGSSAPAATQAQGKYTDPATGYVYDPATGNWTDPATGQTYNEATGWTGGTQTASPSAPSGPQISDPSQYDPYGSGGGGSMAMPGGSTDPSAYDPSFDPGNQAPTPDTSYAGPSEGDDAAPQESDDYPSDMAPAQDMTSFQSPSSTSPVDTFGPEDMGPEENGGGDFGPSFDDASGDGFPGDDASEGSMYADDGSAASSDPASSDDYGLVEEGDDDAVESYPRRTGVDGIGAEVGVGTSILPLSLLAIGAYFLFKRK